MSDQFSDPIVEGVSEQEIAPTETQAGAPSGVADPNVGNSDTGTVDAQDQKLLELQEQNATNIAALTSKYDSRDAEHRSQVKALQAQVKDLMPVDQRAAYEGKLQGDIEDSLRDRNEELQLQLQQQQDTVQWKEYYKEEFNISVVGNTPVEVMNSALDIFQKNWAAVEQQPNLDPSGDPPNPGESPPPTPPKAPQVLTNQNGKPMNLNAYEEMTKRFGSMSKFREQVRLGRVSQQDLQKFSTPE